VTRSRLAWLWVGLAVVVLALALDVWHDRDRNGADFKTYLAAATVGVEQGWSHLYDQPLIAVEQIRLVPSQPAQPFISPPTVAWLVAPFKLLPFWTGFAIWAVFTFAALATALAWSAMTAGVTRWIGVIAALGPWWVLYAVNRGQVVLLVAAGMAAAWRLMRERRDVAAGIALSLLFLKPNTAILAPFALLAAGRYRVFTAWLASGTALVLVAALTLGSDGISAYASQLLGPLPSGADWLTLKGATGATGLVAASLRLLIVGLVLVTAFRFRFTGGLVLPAAILGSLMVAPYLHASDLCLLSTAAWIVWEELASPAWRASLVIGWILASSYAVVAGFGLALNHWPWLEYLLLLALVVAAWRPLTGPADSRNRAPA
jgi:hypothetical protein